MILIDETIKALIVYVNIYLLEKLVAKIILPLWGYDSPLIPTCIAPNRITRAQMQKHLDKRTHKHNLYIQNLFATYTG